jgi:hypothetical protein
MLHRYHWGLFIYAIFIPSPNAVAQPLSILEDYHSSTAKHRVYLYILHLLSQLKEMSHIVQCG